MAINKDTLKTWDQLAEAYRDGFMELDLYNDTYDQLCNLLDKPETCILEIACGPGMITRYLLNKQPDLDILAIDTSPNMIQLAKNVCPQVDFKVMDAREINTISQKFDAVVCGFCIPYLNLEECTQLIKDTAFLLENKGVFYLSFIEGSYEKSALETSSDGKHSMHVYYHTAQFFEKILSESCFQILHEYRKPYIKKDGTITTHLIYITRYIQ